MLSDWDCLQPRVQHRPLAWPCAAWPHLSLPSIYSLVLIFKLICPELKHKKSVSL